MAAGNAVRARPSLPGTDGFLVAHTKGRGAFPIHRSCVMAFRSYPWRARFAAWSALLLICLVAGLGCGAGAGDVSGKVTYKGKALPFGWVGVLPNDGIFRNAEIQSDGTYSFKDLP